MLPERSEVTQQLRVCNRVRKGDDGEDEGDGSRRPVSYLHLPPSPLAPSTTAPPPQQHYQVTPTPIPPLHRRWRFSRLGETLRSCVISCGPGSARQSD